MPNMSGNCITRRERPRRPGGRQGGAAASSGKTAKKGNNAAIVVRVGMKYNGTGAASRNGFTTLVILEQDRLEIYFFIIQ